MEQYFKLFIKFGIAFVLPWAWLIILHIFIGKAKKILLASVTLASLMAFGILVAKEVSDVSGVPLNNEILTYFIGTVFGIAAASLVFNYRATKLGKWLAKNLSDEGTEYKGLHLRQLLEAAIDLEEEGKEFYQSLSLKFNDTNVKNLCLRLAQEENKHKEVIEKMLNRWLPLNSKENSKEEFRKVSKKIGLFVDKPKPCSSQNVMLNYAIEQERKSIELYKSFEKFFPQEWKQQYIEKLVLEEETHLNDLLKIRNTGTSGI